MNLMAKPESLPLPTARASISAQGCGPSGKPQSGLRKRSVKRSLSPIAA